MVGVGADLEPGTLLAAYRSGLFPMGLGGHGRDPMGWWSPDPRGVVPLDGLRVSRSLRTAGRRYEVRVDTAFAEVVAGVRRPDPRRRVDHAGHRRRLRAPPRARAGPTASRSGTTTGWPAGSTAWPIGGLFAGESMFHRRTDASKVALVGLVDLLRDDGDARRLLDVQWATDHLRTLGAVEVPQREYLERLAAAREAPLPPRWA